MGTNKIKYILTKTGFSLKKKHNRTEVEKILTSINTDRYSSILSSDDVQRIILRVYQEI